MPRYFFNVHDGVQGRDDDGVLCSDLQAAAYEADRLLPAIALNRVPADSQRQTITVLVSDSDGHPVYQAALSHVGTWLIR